MLTGLETADEDSESELTSSNPEVDDEEEEEEDEDDEDEEDLDDEPSHSELFSAWRTLCVFCKGDLWAEGRAMRKYNFESTFLAVGAWLV